MIFVSLRMAASTEAPFSPISFHPSLRGAERKWWERASVSTGADTKANTRGGGAHSSEVTALPLSASHSLVMPSVV